jgi:hypothetical protein
MYKDETSIAGMIKVIYINQIKVKYIECSPSMGAHMKKLDLLAESRAECFQKFTVMAVRKVCFLHL